MRTLIHRGALVALALAAATSLSHARSLNGFDLEGASIPPTEIHHGGPPRDGIPAIDAPTFVSVSQVDFLSDTDRVLGIDIDGVQRAYPISILNWHEVVNDTINDRPVIVSFCPLCGTGVVFDGDIGGEANTFGVSGLLYNSDVLLYDRNTESLWSQIRAESVAGPSQGTKLDLLPVTHTSWADWRQRHPGTEVLSTDTGFGRNYTRDPYTGYYTSEQIMFPVSATSRRYHPKEQVLGLAHGGEHRAWPFNELSKTGATHIEDTLSGTDLIVRFDPEHQTASVFTADGTELPGVVSFWFAWYAFHPESSVYTAIQ